MVSTLHELARHNAWATEQILNTCDALSAAALNADATGVYGSVIATLRHLIDAEQGYAFRMTGMWDALHWKPGEPVGLDVLRERARLLSAAWEAFLVTEFDTEKLSEGRGPGQTFAIRCTIFFVQAIHHANEHRAHICTVLSTQGIEPPDVSAWAYSLASGRAWPVDEQGNRIPESPRYLHTTHRHLRNEGSIVWSA